MVKGMRDKAIRSGVISKEAWQRGIKDLYKTTEQDGTFCYTFFKAFAIK